MRTRPLMVILGCAGLLAVAGGMAVPAGAEAGRAHVELYAEVAVVGPELTLGDLARIDAPSPDGRRSLEGVPICYAPVPGSARRISRDYIRLKLRQQRIDPDRVELAGAEVVHIVSVTSTVPAEEIVHAVTEAIVAAMPWTRAEVDIRPQRGMQGLVVPAAAPTLDVAFAPDEQFLGSTLAQVRVYADGVVVHARSYRFHVAVYREVLQARTYIPRGAILGPEHVAGARVDVARLGDRYVADHGAVVGRRAKRSIRAGTRLTPAMLEKPPVVSRGDRVRVNVAGQHFEISLQGQAREAGAVGSVIRVDLPNKRRVYARVSAPGQVVLAQ